MRGNVPHDEWKNLLRVGGRGRPGGVGREAPERKGVDARNKSAHDGLKN